VQTTALLNKNSFCRIHKLPLFASGQTFVRIDFLRQGGQLVDKKATFGVKFPAEKLTKVDGLTSGRVNRLSYRVLA